MMSIFKPLFDQFNEINMQGACVWLPWQQLLPHGVSAAAADKLPMMDGVDAPATTPGQASSTWCADAAAGLTPPPCSSAPFFPDCRTCAKFGKHCPTKQRLSHISNGDGDVHAKLNPGAGPGLLSNTWCADCSDCVAEEGGQLKALQRQRSEVAHCAPTWRRLR
eukprot:5453109-Pleurochrysis_carterae.AAC.1